MIQFCPLAPLPYLDEVVPDFLFIEVAWWRSRQFQKYVLKQVTRSRHMPIVIDNSTHLYGVPYDLSLQLAIARQIRSWFPPERIFDMTIVLPDVKNDGARTIVLLKDTLELHWESLAEAHVRLMLVAQGKTLESWYACADEARKIAQYHLKGTDTPLTLGVPYQCKLPEREEPKHWASNRKHLLENHVRRTFDNILQHYERFHLLGLSNPVELKGYRDVTRDIFCDSSAPFAWAVDSRAFDVHGWDYTDKPSYRLDSIIDSRENFRLSASEILRLFLHNVALCDLYRSATTFDGGALL